MYGDAVFADRFRCQLTMFGIGVLIGLTRLLHGHIACEIDTSTISEPFCRISYFLHDLTRLNSIACHAQTKRCTMVVFDVRFRHQLSMFKINLLTGLSRLLGTHIAYQTAI